MESALSSVIILDLSRVLAGPYGTMVLADFGADVIKVEQPGRGDDTRQWGPPFTQSGQSAYFLSTNRNKQSITLNLKSEEGRAILHQLVQQADILIENFKVGTMDRLGIGYEALKAINPGLIYCAITGYGQNGPYRNRPGYDTVIQAQAGVMSITGPTEDGTDGEPFKVGVAIVDVTAGLHAAVSILAALHYRQQTGKGQFIDIALFDAQLGWLVNVASSYLVSGERPKRYGNAHGTIVPYQTFATPSGYLMLAVGNDRQFSDLCRVIDEPDLAEDARFATNPQRVRHRAVLIPRLAAIFAQRNREEWIQALLDRNVPCGPVNDIPSALSDPQAVARDMVQEIREADGESDRANANALADTLVNTLGGEEGEGEGETVRLVGPVAKLSETPLTIRRAPPRLGADTERVLQERLGLSTEEIAGLRERGVV